MTNHPIPDIYIPSSREELKAIDDFDSAYWNCKTLVTLLVESLQNPLDEDCNEFPFSIDALHGTLSILLGEINKMCQPRDILDAARYARFRAAQHE